MACHSGLTRWVAHRSSPRTAFGKKPVRLGRLVLYDLEASPVVRMLRKPELYGGREDRSPGSLLNVADVDKQHPRKVLPASEVLQCGLRPLLKDVKLRG